VQYGILRHGGGHKTQTTGKLQIPHQENTAENGLTTHGSSSIRQKDFRSAPTDPAPIDVGRNPAFYATDKHHHSTTRQFTGNFRGRGTGSSERNATAWHPGDRRFRVGTYCSNGTQHPNAKKFKCVISMPGSDPASLAGRQSGLPAEASALGQHQWSADRFAGRWKKTTTGSGRASEQHLSAETGSTALQNSMLRNWQNFHSSGNHRKNTVQLFFTQSRFHYQCWFRLRAIGVLRTGFGTGFCAVCSGGWRMPLDWQPITRFNLLFLPDFACGQAC
jgi:hypothetical protein